MNDSGSAKREDARPLHALLFKAPAFMVQIGGWGTAFILLVIIFSSFYHRYRVLPKELAPGKFYDAFLFIGSAAILVVAFYSIYVLVK